MTFIPALGAAAAGAAANPITPYLASAGMGLLGNSSRKSSPGSPSQVVTMPQYSFTEPRLRLMSDFVSDNISRAGRGEAPAYFDRAVPAMRAGLERGVQTTYFGRPGDRTGSVQAALEAGSIAGTGPKPGSSMVNKALQRYEEAGKQIEEYISNARMNATQTSIGTSLQAGIQMPKGPDAQIIGGYGAQTTGGGVDALTSIAQNLPWLQNQLTNPGGAGGSSYGDLSGGYGDITGSMKGNQLWGNSAYDPNVDFGIGASNYSFGNSTSAAAPSMPWGNIMNKAMSYYSNPAQGGVDAGQQAVQFLMNLLQRS